MHASYEHGVLTVTIPVAEKAKPRKIAVQTQGQPEAIEATAT
jgi:HSP20 family protein